MKKHAYMIVAYDNQHQLEQLLSLLDHQRNDIYLQIDSKGSLDTKKLAMSQSTLFVLPPFKIYWGGYSFIQAIVDLLREAGKRGYHYYHLLSGSDLPLVSQASIHEYLENSDTEFVDFAPEYFSFAHFKAAFYHVLVETSFYRRFLFIRAIGNLLAKIQAIIGIDRSRKQKIIYYHGSTWFSITHRCAEYVIEHESWIKRHFRHGLACDEVFLQTLLMTSPFSAKICSHDQKMKRNLRYIDWKRRDKNSPYTFRFSDFEELREASGQAFFARKFNRNVDSAIVDTIVERIRNHSSL